MHRKQLHTYNFNARTLILIALLGVMAGCGANSPYYKHAEERPDHQTEINRGGTPAFTLFLIGDTGSPTTNPPEPNLQTLRRHLEKAGKQSAVIFLGDNIYSYGLLPENHPKRSDSERRIDTQLRIFDTYQGRAIFIPGNHDWNDDRPGGLESLLRQQNYIENRLGPNAFMPENGCPGPVEVRLDSSNILLIMDTEWWLYPHTKPGSKQCANGGKQQFIRATDSLITHHSDKNIVVAGHHPLYSNGTHNGYFPAKDHFFPLLDYSPVLYIPLPILGSVNPLYRKYIGYRQDLAGKEYSQLRKQLISVLKKHPNIVYAAGHAHSLQYHPIDRQHYIVSGAGTVKTYVRKGKSAAFAYSHKGFARIDIYGKETILSFWTPEGNQAEGRLVYQKLLYEN